MKVEVPNIVKKIKKLDSTFKFLKLRMAAIKSIDSEKLWNLFDLEIFFKILFTNMSKTNMQKKRNTILLICNP